MIASTFPAGRPGALAFEAGAGPALRVLAVVLLHGGLIAWLASGTSPADAPARPEPLRMEVRTIAAPRPAAALKALEPPPRAAVPPTPAPRPTPASAQARPTPAPVRPAPVAVASPAAPAEAPPVEAAPVHAPAPVASQAPQAPVAPASEAPLQAPRFDAAYLDNPAPAYPLISRRRGEEGTVMLLVRVSADGAAQHVEVQHSCGHPRLDEAAAKAVRGWRFAPARRGGEPVAASVVVPIVFALDA